MLILNGGDPAELLLAAPRPAPGCPRPLSGELLSSSASSASQAARSSSMPVLAAPCSSVSVAGARLPVLCSAVVAAAALMAWLAILVGGLPWLWATADEDTVLGAEDTVLGAEYTGLPAMLGYLGLGGPPGSLLPCPVRSRGLSPWSSPARPP